MNGNGGYHGYNLPRYFITIGKKILFDYPKDFDTTYKYGFNSYPWDTDISAISKLIEDYIQRPETEIMKPFDNDKWGLTDILRVCDRRVGKRRLQEIKDHTSNERILYIINIRNQ